MTHLKHFLVGDKLDLFNVVSKGLREKKWEQSVGASGWDTGAQHEETVSNTQFSKVDLPDLWDPELCWEWIVMWLPVKANDRSFPALGRSLTNLPVKMLFCLG